MKRIGSGDVTRLANLAMLPVASPEIEVIADEMNGILHFFSAVERFSAGKGETWAGSIRARDDGNCASSGDQADQVIANFPAKENRLLLVPRGL
jgi:Asp-tRNA(Asn)/Glu-tRNA(Gln) amidotransferase C subunit